MHTASIRKVKVGEKTESGKKRESWKKVKVLSWKVKLQKVKVTREKVIVKLNSATATIGCFDHRSERLQLYNIVSLVRLFCRIYLLLCPYFCFEIVFCRLSILQLNQLAIRVVRANCYALNITYMQSYFVFCCMLATFYPKLNQLARWLHPLALSMCKVVPCWLPNSTILLFIGSQHCAYRFPNLSDLKYGLINSSDIKKTQPSIHN